MIVANREHLVRVPGFGRIMQMIESNCRSSQKEERDRLKLPLKREADVTPPHDKLVAPPKKKDGRGRPRKDRTLAAQQQAASASAAVATSQVYRPRGSATLTCLSLVTH